MRTVWKAALQKQSLLLICALSVALGFSLAANFYNHHASSPAVAAPTADSWRTMFRDVADALEPSVVNVTSEKMVEKRSMVPDFPGFFDFGPFSSPRSTPRVQKQPERNTGSGVIVRSDGYILTNDHVVGGADRVTVKLKDGREFKGTVLRDQRTDLALVKIDAKDLPTVSFADSDKVRVGEWAIAIGNPFGLRNTVTVGVVSAVRRDVDPDNPLPYPEVIQTDASINPGNSGGPLVDLDGRLIGINGAIYSTSRGNQGIGFAIPSNTAKFVVDQLISKGKVVRGYLGLEPIDLDPVLADKLGVKEGALVNNVVKDSAAEKGGVKVKDVIVKVDDKPIRSAVELRRTVQRITPDTNVKLVVVRDKKEKSLSVKLAEAPNGEDVAEAGGDTDAGMSVAPLTADLAKELGVDEGTKGVVVRSVEPGTPAERAGVHVRDVIVEIDDAPVTSVASFSKAIANVKKGDTVIVVVERRSRSLILKMTMD